MALDVLIDACAATGPSADAHRRVEYGPMATAIGAHTAAVQLLASLAADESCAKTGPNIRDCVKRYEARIERRAAAWRSRKSPRGFQNRVNTASRPGTCLYRS